MRTILVTILRYLNGQEVDVDIVYRGLGWSINKDIKDWCVVDIYGEKGVIASYKTWQSIKFADEANEETIL